MSKHTVYSELEEKMNVYSHVFGFFLSILGFIILLIKNLDKTNLHILSGCIFTLSMIFLYFSSANYHYATDKKKRFRLKIVDHCAIYVLIAGSYTPYTLVTLINSSGILLFSIAWAFALIGICLKLLFTGRFKVFSTLIYLAMGWMVIFFIKPLMSLLPQDGFYLLALGGLFYTTGALIYLIKRIPLNHAIFHLFVLAGSISHFLSIYWYV
tara:strand:+ start:81080 stop:81712 length:633 start_codon:yes stop_codon:yes gene_type:complete